MPRYWYNELPSEECYLPNGKKIRCDFIQDDRAWLCTDLGFVNAQIENAIQRHIGGWCVADERLYQEALKKKQRAPTGTQKRQWFKPDRSPSLNPSGAVAGSVATKRGVEVPLQPRPDPIRVPTPEQMRPRKGPIPREAII